MPVPPSTRTEARRTDVGELEEEEWFESAAARSSSSHGASSCAKEEVEDWERRTLELVAARDADVADVATEDVLCVFVCPGSLPDFEGTGEEVGEGEERSSPAVRSLLTSLTASVSSELGVVGCWEYARSIPRLTMRSHLRLSWASSASCAASWERSSRHLDSFCAMKRRRSACLLPDTNTSPYQIG